MELQWPLIFFTLFVAAGAGFYCTAAASALTGKATEIQRPSLIAGTATLIVGGLCSVFHLQTPLNYFNQLGNFASGINQEIVALGISIMVAAIALFVMKNDAQHGMSKAVAGVLGVASLVLVCVMAHSYLMPAIPTWDTLLLPVYYLANTAVFAALAFGLMERAVGIAESSSKASVAAIVALAALVTISIAYVAYFGSVDYAPRLWWDGNGGPVDAAGAATAVPAADPSAIAGAIFAGAYAGLFWGVAIIAGAVAPAIAVALAWRKPLAKNASIAAYVGSIALVCAGGIAFRALLYVSAASYFLY